MDTLTSRQEEQEIDNSDDEEGTVIEENPAMEDDEDEETNTVEENEVVMVSEEEEEKEERDNTIADSNKTGDDVTQDERLEEMEGDDTINDTSETDKAIEPVPEALNQEMPEMESQAMDEQIDADNIERTEGETENLVEKKNVSPAKVAASDLVS